MLVLVDHSAFLSVPINMGILDVFKLGPKPEQAIKDQGFEVSDCSLECLGCTSKFPSSVAFKDDDKSQLYGNTDPFGLHVVVATNKSDWQHDATLVRKTLANKVAKWAADASFPGLGDSTKIKVSASSLCSSAFDTDEEYQKETRGDVLLLPFFVWVRNLELGNAGDVLDRVVADLIKARDSGSKEFPSLAYDAFPNVRIEAEHSKAYVFLCSHKTRDKRCGITAPIMKKEFELNLRDLDLYRDVFDSRAGGVRIAFINHVGGHKFAANVIIYLRSSGKNIWLARCRPNNVLPIIEECIVNDGKVWPEHVRRVQKFKPIEW